MKRGLNSFGAHDAMSMSNAEPGMLFGAQGSAAPEAGCPVSAPIISYASDMLSGRRHLLVDLLAKTKSLH